jgi:hypothetical protein
MSTPYITNAFDELTKIVFGLRGPTATELEDWKQFVPQAFEIPIKAQVGFLLSFSERLNTRELSPTESKMVTNLLDCMNNDWDENPHRLRLGLYDHFKGGVYLVEGFSSWASGEGEQLVEYISLSNGKRFARFATQWCEIVKWPDGRYRSRFVYRGIPLECQEPSFKVRQDARVE